MSGNLPSEAQDFKTIQFVGIPSRPINEPMALDHVHALVTAVLRSEELAEQTDKQTNSPPVRAGHRVEIFDLGQLANLAVGDDHNTLPPRELLKIFEVSQHENLQARYETIVPVSNHVMAVHQAIIRALKLDRKIKVTVASMIEDPEELFHDAPFRRTITSLIGAQSMFVHALTEEQTVIDVLMRLVPNRYRPRMQHLKGSPKAEGYLSYGILETAALIRTAIAGIHVLQYDVMREQGYADLAKAIIRQVHQEDAEVAERIEKMSGVKGVTLHSGTEADTYRMSRKDLRKGARLPVNPPLSVNELATSLLNGAGRFDTAKSELIKLHILRMLDRGADILNIDMEIREKLSDLYDQAKNSGVSVINPEDAQFVLEQLHHAVYEPIAKELEKENLLYTEDEATNPNIHMAKIGEENTPAPSADDTDQETVQISARGGSSVKVPGTDK